MHGRRRIIAAEAIFEPEWQSGKGELIYSFSVLTINAASHSLMQNFHKPYDTKRMVVILPPEWYQDWLVAKPADSMCFMLPFTSNSFQSEPVAPKQKALLT